MKTQRRPVVPRSQFWNDHRGHIGQSLSLCQRPCPAATRRGLFSSPPPPFEYRDLFCSLHTVNWETVTLLCSSVGKSGGKQGADTPQKRTDLPLGATSSISFPSLLSSRCKTKSQRAQLICTTCCPSLGCCRGEACRLVLSIMIT